MVFTFSYRIHIAQLGIRKFPSAVTSPWFLDNRSNLKWSVKVQPVGRTPTEPKHLDIYLRRSIEGVAKEEESEFADLTYVEVGSNKIFSRTTKANSTRNYHQGSGMGYEHFVPISVLEGEETVNVGVVIYFKAK